MNRLVLLAALAGAFVGTDSTSGFAPRAPNYGIAGRVWGDYDVENTVIQITGAATIDLRLSEYGTFSIGGLVEGTYRVTPSCPGQTFTPPFREVTHVRTDRRRGTAMVEFQVHGSSSGGSGTGGWVGTGAPPDYAPGGDQLVLHRAKIKAEKGKVKITATLVPGAGHAVEPEDGLTLWLNGRPLILVDGSELEMRGTSGLKYRCLREDAKVTMKYTGGWTRSAKIKVKVKGFDLEGLDLSQVTLTVTTGDYAAAASRWL
jgi:hypothetical protein